MTTLSNMPNDIFPREDIVYCYVCSKPMIVQRFRGDREQYELAHAQECYDTFVDVKHLDLHPVVCATPKCRAIYDALPAPSYREEKVPFLTDVVFDGGSFFDFPSRNKRPEIISEEATYPITRDYHFQNARKLEPLFQAWLFFGFLHEILGNFDDSDYVYEDEHGILMLTIKPLLASLAEWMKSVPRNTTEDTARIRRLQEAVALVKKFLGCLHGTSFDEATAAFIALTAEIVALALHVLLPTGNEDVVYFGSHIPQSRVSTLQNLGWCPSLAHRFARAQPWLSNWALHSCLVRNQRGADHSTCSIKECVMNLQLHLTQRGATHHLNCKQSNCGDVSIDQKLMDCMCSMLSAGQVPLLRVQDVEGDSSQALDVVAYKPNVKYVAISHVWSQGLGNEDDNSIKHCNWSRLVSYVKQLPQLLSVDGKRQELLLWLDTLCCPVAKRAIGNARKEALKLMRFTYQNAMVVLVLDTELEDLSVTDRSPLEVCAYAFTASWNWRLWTLQEGAFAGELWFRFHDRAINAQCLWLAIREYLRKDDMRSRNAAYAMIDRYMQIRQFSRHASSSNSDSRVRRIMWALAGRAVTHYRDEAYCIATLLNLDPTSILETEDPQWRMTMLWHLFSDAGFIPRKIAFHFGDKLKIPGWRWALSTFCQTGSGLGFTGTGHDAVGEITPEGLLITGAGFRLAGPKGTRNKAILTETEYTLIQTTHGKWLILTPLDTAMEESFGEVIEGKPSLLDILWDSGKQIALIRESLSDSTTKGGDEYLLVEVCNRSDERILCTPLRLVGIREVSTTLHGLNIEQYPSIVEEISDETQIWILM